MKMLKRSLALMLALVMMIGAMPFTAFASESTDVPSEPTEAVVDAPAGETTPSEGAEEETVAEETVVETTVAEETVPETTVAEETVPEETVPEETVVDEPVVEEPVEEVPAVMSLTKATTQSDTFTHKIVHLDNGRKYYTAEWIKALITEMAADGFTQLQLAFGNDGLRFLLDDMSVTVNGTTYSSANVTAGIQAGNKAYYDDGVNELTQAEMDEIIAHAKAKGIEIVPHMNMPGHMDAILDAIEYVGISDAHFTGYTTSVRSLNLNNDTAVAFTKALLEKYVTYFDAKGCSYFHIGADEFGNDAYNGGMGFPNMGSTLYTKFATFVNDCAAIVTDAGMTPRAWNDGISYTGYSDSFDTDIEITYWSSGWGGYDVASASTLRSNGHSMINTNGDYYYILGVNDCYTSGTTTTHAGYDYTAAEGFTNSTFMGSTISDPIGSMFCIWADVPGAETETEVAQYIRPILRVMASRMAGSSSYEVDTIVEGGFNADGSINVVETEETETVTKTDEATGVVVSAAGLTGLTVAEATAPVIEGAAEGKVLAWDIVPATDAGNYEDAATVAVPVPDGWDSNKMGAFVVNDDSTITLIDGALNADGKFEFTMPHFSVGGVYEAEATAEDVYDTLVELTVGETSKTYTDNSGYYTTADGLDSTVATATLGGQSGSESTATYSVADVTVNNLIDSNSTTWVDTGYYYKNGTNYYPLYAKRSGGDFYDYTFTWGYSTTGSANSVTDISTQQERWYNVDYYETEPDITVYEQSGTEAVPAQTTVSFTGKSVGTTYATVGEITYKIVVSKAAVTDTVTIDTSKTYEDTSATVSVEDPSIATATLSNGTLTITGVKVGSTTVTTDNAIYTITVTELDLSTIESLEIEYWQTNSVVVESIGSTVNCKTVAAEDVYSADGVELTELVPQSAYKKTAAEGDAAVTYWRTRLLPLPGNEQTDSSGDDETLNGVGFTKIRYWNGSWAVYTDANVWQEIEPDDYQMAAYYMNDMNLADEVKVGTADWGKKGNGDLSGEYLGSNNVSIAFQIVYEDGTTAPAGTTADDLAAVTYLVDNWNPRGVGTIALNQIGAYQIWKVTAETGTHTTDYYVGNGTDTSAYKPVHVTNFTWDNNEVTVYEGEPVSQYTIVNPAPNPLVEGDTGYESYYENLKWDETNESILIRIYIKTVITEDTLNVVYYDEKFGNTLYTYGIDVDNGVTFNDIEPTPSAFAGNTERIDVTGCSITNAIDKVQYFQTDLTKVPEAVGKYKNNLYTYTGSEISEDGKTLYLYYNIDTSVLEPNFVVDFGLPFTFSLSDVVAEGQEEMVESVTASAQQGTVTYDSVTQTFTYTPTNVLRSIDVLSIKILFDGSTAVSTTNVGVTPATTVYYGEKFINFDSYWSTSGTATTANQKTEVLGKSTYYGYDSAYSNTTGASDGTAKTATKIGSSGTFTFTGNGVQVFATSTTSTGYVSVKVTDASGNIVKVSMVDTAATNGATDATTGQNVNLNGLPIVSLVDLQNIAHDTYTVTITKVMDEKPVYIDGIRVFNTVHDTTEGEKNIYYADKEDLPAFHELRDMVLNAIGVGEDTSVDYKTMYQQVYNATAGAYALITDESVTYGNSSTIQDLLDKGPKNELYLHANQTLTFKVTTARAMQIGLKAPNGATTYTLECTNVATKTDVAMNSSVDMFYPLDNATGTETTFTVTVKNTGSKILSVTLLKICDDPNAAFVALTEDDVKNILADAGYTDDEVVEPEVPTEPEVPETTTPTEPEVEETTKPTEPSKPTEPTEPETKPTEPEVEETKPSKPGKPDKEEKPSKPSKPGKDEEKTEKVATLKVTYVSLFGRKVGTATLTKEGNGRCVFTPAEIRAGAPAGCRVLWMIPTMINYGTSASIIVPVI